MKDQNLTEKFKELDKIDLETSWSKEDLWEAVEFKMAGQKKSRQFSMTGWKALPWAAIVFFALGSYWWSNEESTQVKVVEIVVNTEVTEGIERDDSLEEGKDFILEACRKQLDVCTSPSFQVLFTELTRIEEEKDLLSEAVRHYGADEVATRALIQLENAESSLTSQLVSMIVI